MEGRSMNVIDSPERQSVQSSVWHEAQKREVKATAYSENKAARPF
jgi:hypothetical protein